MGLSLFTSRIKSADGYNYRLNNAKAFMKVELNHLEEVSHETRMLSDSLYCVH